MLALPDERFSELIEAGQSPPTDLAAEEAAVAFAARRPTDGYLEVRSEVLKRWGYRCAVTDTQFAGEAPELRLVPIRPRDRGGPLHAANYLPMVELAEHAWRAGAISVTETCEFVAVMDRLDPDLLAAMPPDGRLIVPEDPALRPDSAHLAWHRANVFGR
jgi:predicted restriction endonuclease